MNKLSSLVILITIFSIFPISAEVDPGTVPFANQTEQVREIIEEQKWNYIGEQWTKILLSNPFIAAADSFFHTINVVFLVLFARPYSLSLELFIAFLLWLFTFLSLQRYMVWTKGWLAVLSALVITVLIAQVQVFNYLATALFKIMFYKSSPGWTVISSLLLCVGLFTYYYLNKILGRTLRKAYYGTREHQAEIATQKLEKLTTSIEKGSEL